MKTGTFIDTGLGQKQVESNREHRSLTVKSITALSTLWVIDTVTKGTLDFKSVTTPASKPGTKFQFKKLVGSIPSLGAWPGCGFSPPRAGGS